MWNPFKKKDPLERQRANYALAFDIIPKILNAFEVGNIPLSDLEKTTTFMGAANGNEKKIIKWKKLQLVGTSFNNYPNKYMIIVRFPEPFTLSSAKSGAIVIDKENRHTRYFTLEVSLGGCMIVEIFGLNRNNTGITIADNNDLTEFSSIIYGLAIK